MKNLVQKPPGRLKKISYVYTDSSSFGSTFLFFFYFPRNLSSVLQLKRCQTQITVIVNCEEEVPKPTFVKLLSADVSFSPNIILHSFLTSFLKTLGSMSATYCSPLHVNHRERERGIRYRSLSSFLQRRGGTGG